MLEEFTKSQIFQQFQAVKMMSSSSASTLAKTDNQKSCLASSVSRPWIIDLRASDHRINSSIFSAFDSTSSFSMITLADGSTSIIGCADSTGAKSSLTISSGLLYA